MRKSIAPMWPVSPGGRHDLPEPHRRDEFPAEYSLASCSPAEPASACSAGLMLHRAPIVCRAQLSERQPGTLARVSPKGFTPLRLRLRAGLNYAAPTALVFRLANSTGAYQVSSHIRAEDCPYHQHRNSLCLRVSVVNALTRLALRCPGRQTPPPPTPRTTRLRALQ